MIRLGLAVAAVAGLTMLPVLQGSPASAASTGAAASLAERSASGQEAWVAIYSFQSQPGDTITPVDLVSHRTDPTVTTASEPAALASVAEGRTLLVANRGNDTLSALDTATGVVAHTVTVGLEPDAVDVVPGSASGTGTALVADFGADTVTPVNLATMRAGAPIHVGREPDAIGVTAVGAGGTSGAGVSGTALVANFGSDTVTPIDLATMQAGPPIGVGSEPDAIGIVPGRAGSAGTALVANFGGTTLSPVNLGTMQAGSQIGVGGNPTGIAVAPGGTAWVVGGASLTPVAAAASGTFTAGASLPLPGVGEAVALQGAATAWVAQQDGSLVPVTLATGTVGRSVRVGGRPSAVVIP